jgi:hypothetical protein
VASDDGTLPAVVGQLVEEPAATIGVGAGLRQAEDDLGRPVVERQGDRRADVLRLGPALAHLVEERAHQPHGIEAGAREATVDHRLQAVAQRPEGDRRGQRGERGRERRAAQRQAGEQRDEHVRGRQQEGERGVDERPADELVDGIETVAGHGHGDRHRRPDLEYDERELAGRLGERSDEA